MPGTRTRFHKQYNAPYIHHYYNTELCRNFSKEVKVLLHNSQTEPIKTDLDALCKIKWCVDVATGAVNSDGEKNEKEPEREEPAKKKSILAELEKNKAKVKENESQKKSPARNGQER